MKRYYEIQIRRCDLTTQADGYGEWDNEAYPFYIFADDEGYALQAVDWYDDVFWDPDAELAISSQFAQRAQWTCDEEQPDDAEIFRNQFGNPVDVVWNGQQLQIRMAAVDYERLDAQQKDHFDHERDIAVLEEDGCTRKDAERHLKAGTVVYDDFDKSYLDGWDLDDDQREEYLEMIRTGKPIADWSVVDLDGQRYFVEYVF